MDKKKTSITDIAKRADLKNIGAYVLTMLFFVTLIIIYNTLLYSATRENIEDDGKASAEQLADQFDKYLASCVDALRIAEYSVETIMRRNAPDEEITDYLTRQSDVIINTIVKNTTGLYAYINGKYYDGGGWVPDDDYVPTERPWYQKAILNKGSITIVDPYLDQQTGNMILTLAKCMNDGKTVVALDITLEDVQAITEKVTVENGSTVQMLLCSHADVVAHSDRNELGKNYLNETDSLGAAVAQKLFAKPEPSFELTYAAKVHVVYAVELDNGWYSISVVESSSAYLPLNLMLLASCVAIILTIMILVLIMLKSRMKDTFATQLNAQLSSAADIYISLCDINIPDNSVIAIKNANPAIAKAVDSCDHNMQEIFFGIMRGLPESSTKQSAIDFCDLSTIDERMKDANTLTLEYLSYGNIWVRARYVVSERDHDGNITHVLWMLENIDAEKRARDKLSHEAETLQSQLSSAADIYISLCDLDILDNSVTAIKNANPAIEKAVNSCKNNMQDIFFGIMKGLPESPTKQAAIDFADMATIDERMGDANTITLEYLSYGNIWVRARYVVSERTPEGKITHVLWMLENIDKEKKARDKLTAVAEKLNHQMASVSNIYEAVYDFDLINDTMSEVKSASSVITEIVNHGEGNHANATLASVIRQMTDPSTLDLLLEFADLRTLPERLAQDNTVTAEYMSIGKKWRRARFIVSERLPDGTISHVLGLFADIDREKQEREKLIDMSERAIAANEAKSAFLSNMSHEIRTPINAVLGMNEMVLRECTDSNILNYSENIRTAGTTLLGLINDILDFSKIEAGKMEIIPVDYNLSGVLNDLVNMIRTRAETKGLTLITDFDSSTPEILHGDEVRIKQVITNILTNAVKYTEKGSVTFGVGFARVDNEPDSVILKVYVRDTGIGIKKEDMAKLFSEFERIEEKRNRSIEGTGLGMSITTSLLGLMGSSLKVDSVYGEGSVFSFELKQAVKKWAPIGDYEQAHRLTVSEHKKYREKFTAPDARVLVVDDTHMNLVVFTSLLKQTNVQIDTADSGDDGLLLMMKNEYDIIFLDHMMPNKDGIETMKEFKASSCKLNRNTPMICLTANAISGAREKYIEAGFDDYLTKPIDFVKLEEMMYDYLPAEKKKIVAEAPQTPAKPKRLLPDFIFDITEIDVSEGIKNSGSEEIYIRVLVTYRDMIPSLLNEIHQYFIEGNNEMLSRKLGTLKSSSRTAGAEWIKRLALKLQNATKENDMETVRENIEELSNRCRWLCIDLSPLCFEEKKE